MIQIPDIRRFGEGTEQYRACAQAWFGFYFHATELGYDVKGTISDATFKFHGTQYPQNAWGRAAAREDLEMYESEIDQECGGYVE
jgi:hypothetical protein